MTLQFWPAMLRKGSPLFSLAQISNSPTTQVSGTSDNSTKIWNLLPVFSAFAVVAITIVWQWWKSKCDNQLKFVGDQLANIYGPLHYLITMNQSRFTTYDKYHEIITKESANKVAPEAHEARMRHVQAMIEEANTFIDDVKENNKKIIEILRDKWYLVDNDDFECFTAFDVDMARLARVGGPQNPNVLLTFEHLGPIPYMRPEMVNRVKTKFDAKRKRLEDLTNGRWGTRLVPLK